MASEMDQLKTYAVIQCENGEKKVTEVVPSHWLQNLVMSSTTNLPEFGFCPLPQTFKLKGVNLSLARECVFDPSWPVVEVAICDLSSKLFNSANAILLNYVKYLSINIYSQIVLIRRNDIL